MLKLEKYVMLLVKTKQKERVAKAKKRQAVLKVKNLLAVKANQEILTSIKVTGTEVENLLAVKKQKKGVVKRKLKNAVRIALNFVVRHHQQLKKLHQQ